MKNKLAVVTDAASGIGEDCARKFAAQGAMVVIADLNLESAGQSVLVSHGWSMP